MKHTKGKWYINKLYSYIGIYNHSNDKAIARLPYTSGDSAKLISKAPEMYKLLDDWAAERSGEIDMNIGEYEQWAQDVFSLLKEIEA